MTRRRPLALAFALAAGLPLPLPLSAQAPDSAPPLPSAGPWDPIRALGQPKAWKPYLGLAAGYGWEDEGDGGQVGGTLGIYRDLAPALTGRIGWQAEAYGGTAGGELDGGARFMLRSPFHLLGAGIDWNFRLGLGRPRAVVSLQLPPSRGGLLGRGGDLRLDWLAGADQALQVGVQFPVGQPRIGRTRPHAVAVELPRPARVERLPPPQAGSPVARELDRMRDAAGWVTRLSGLLWDLGIGASTRDLVASTEIGVAVLRSDLLLRDPRRPGLPPYERELLAYHGALERAFGLAGGAPDSAAQAAGAPVAAAARQAALEEVLLPWNGAVGRYRVPATLAGLAARARARFAGWLAARGTSDPDDARLGVFDEWIEELEATRREVARRTGDSRREWLPMGLALRPEEHRTQAQVDALIARATGEAFSGGNAVLHLPAQQFPGELSRTIQEAEQYHLLWIDAFHGVDDLGQPDRIGFYQTALGYLSALTRRVREFDRTGRLPTYLLLLDQENYDERGSRLWLDLLEHPLDHRVVLPERHAAMDQVLAAWQDSLRDAVAGSRRLAGEAAALGPAWVRERIKVHVSVINPADFSFRTHRLPGFPLGADNEQRDHRRLVLRDVSEADPAAGEMLLSGVGVGDRFTSAEWEDRVLLVTGPAAARAKRAAREVLLRNGLAERDLPAALRASPPGPDPAARIAALEAAGSTARALQVHNGTGWAAKEASFTQLLLWDLAPAGTAIYVADDRWGDPLWAAQLLAAALRGCEVFAVGPSRANAPDGSAPVMASTRRLFIRLTVVQQELGDVIRQGGGDLHIGLYTRRSPVGIPEAKLWEVDTTYGKYAFLRSQYPFPEATWRMLWDHRARMDSLQLGREVVPPEQRDRLPRLHRRTQFLGSRALLEQLAVRPETHVALDATMRDWSEGVTAAPEPGPIPAQRRAEVTRQLLAGYDGMPAAVRDSTLLYFALGTTAKDTRSLAHDGGVIALVSGRWSLAAWLDFWLLFGSTTWVERVEELEGLIPLPD
ncbi:MAG TPA: hypothetical protein VLA95_05350 [Gemmatimonadales bacterium]|nr:hypothetical protein [Gemmatimonadales bacterium]